MARQNHNPFFENQIRFQKTVALASTVAAFAALAAFAEDPAPGEGENAEPPAGTSEAVAETVVEEPEILDSDGDLIPDDSDPLPFIANVPVYWSVQKFSVSRTAGNSPLSDSWKDSLSLVLSAVPAPVPLKKSLTAQPLVSRKANGKISGHPFGVLGVYGSGRLPWGDLQRERTKRFLDGFRRDGASPLTLSFSVNFTGLGAPRVFSDLAVPVLLGGKKYADAVPVGGNKGLATPAAGKTATVEFTAEITAKDAENFLARLSKGDAAPLFDFERAVDLDLALRNLFESVAGKTVEIVVSEPAGTEWRWRVSRSAERTLAMWAEEMNERFRQVYGMPFADFGDFDGYVGVYPLSVCGWDSGALGQWWTVKSGNSVVDFGRVAALRLSAPLSFSLSSSRPRLIPEDVCEVLSNQLATAGLAFADDNPAAAYPDVLAKMIDGKQKSLADAVWHGGAEIWSRYGMQLLESGSHEGIDWLELAASRGSVPAYARLAKIYLNGEFDRVKDGKTAVAFLQKAADGGDVPSMVTLAEKYRAGEYLRKNDKLAAKYFAMAAEAGNLEGQTWYALSLLEGAGVRKDTEAGMAWLRHAADAGYDNAQYLLAVFLFCGYDGVEKNQGEAFALFASAAKTQIPAKVFLGYCYLNGLGTVKDEKRAVACFREAADVNVVAGYIWLAYCYANGLGIEKNVETARNWARKAIDAGSPVGRKMLLMIQE